MRTRSFQKYLEKRLSKEEIAEIKKQARLEIEALRTIQEEAADVFMKKNQNLFKLIK